MPTAWSDFIFVSAIANGNAPAAAQMILFPTAKEAQLFSASNLFPLQRFPVVFLPHADKAELQRSASVKIPALTEVHSMQGAFDALKLSGVKFVLVNPLQNKTTIDVAWMSVAKQKNISVVFALPDLQAALQLQKSRPFEEFQKLARLLSHYKVSYFIASFARDENEILGEEELESLRVYLEEEKLLHHIQLQFDAENATGFIEESDEAMES